jgi:hypothetical protein
VSIEVEDKDPSIYGVTRYLKFETWKLGFVWNLDFEL